MRSLALYKSNLKQLDRLCENHEKVISFIVSKLDKARSKYCYVKLYGQRGLSLIRTQVWMMFFEQIPVVVDRHGRSWRFREVYRGDKRYLVFERV